jgi:hypothetical protein
VIGSGEKAMQLAVAFLQSSAAVHISFTSVKHCFPSSENDCSDALSIETIHHLMCVMLPESICISFQIIFIPFLLFMFLYNVGTGVSLNSWEEIGV